VLTECQEYAMSLTKTAELMYAVANLWFIKSVFFSSRKNIYEIQMKN